MTKADLVAQIAYDTNKTQDEVAVIVDAFISTTKKALINKENITLRGFGTFKNVKRLAKLARVPKTGEEMVIPAHRAVTFKVSDAFKEAVKQ